MPYTLTASVQPITATAPFTYIWKLEEQALVTRTSGLSNSINVLWSVPGVQPVTVTVQNLVSKQVINTHIVVQDVPIAGLTATNNSPLPVNTYVNFRSTVNAGSNITYVWNFGDGNLSNGATTSHMYVLPGTYMASLTAKNSAGSVSVSIEVTISDILTPTSTPTGTVLATPIVTNTPALPTATPTPLSVTITPTGTVSVTPTPIVTTTPTVPMATPTPPSEIQPQHLIYLPLVQN